MRGGPLVGAILLLLGPARSWGESTSSGKYASSLGRLGTREKALASRANAYFKNLDTLRSDFWQSSGSAAVDSRGTLEIARPGRLRLEYLSSPRSLFISNGGTMSYYDVELDEVSILPSSRIPLVFLLARGKGLDSMDSDILEVVCSGSDCRIITETRAEEVSYLIEYTFDKNIENLLEIAITPDGEERIGLRLVNSEINPKIDEKDFIFRNPRIYKNRK
ncbi:MAG: outer membrane lipoprotein carrier protein LolA [Rickettsiales bacterium]|nr:outer membrane lipoprotein carrier protein LolA [Rickettsiales bacterium]